VTENRRIYDLSNSIVINDLNIKKVIIDAHVDKHKDHVNDDLILELVKKLSGRTYDSEDYEDGFQYFVNVIEHNQSKYRLVWLLEDHSFYVGVITAFKDKGVK